MDANATNPANLCPICVVAVSLSKARHDSFCTMNTKAASVFCRAWPPTSGARRLRAPGRSEVSQIRTKRKLKHYPSGHESLFERTSQRNISRFNPLHDQNRSQISPQIQGLRIHGLRSPSATFATPGMINLPLTLLLDHESARTGVIAPETKYCARPVAVESNCRKNGERFSWLVPSDGLRAGPGFRADQGIRAQLEFRALSRNS